MIHNICATGVIYIGVKKVGSARNWIHVIDNAPDGIWEIDDTRGRIGMHNVIRGNNGTIIDAEGWIIIKNIIRERLSWFPEIPRSFF